MTDAQVQIEAVRKQFGAFEALKTVNLSIATGEVIALLGPSGCGKTTLLRCIAGLEMPTSGTISISGRNVFSSTDGIDEPPERRRIGLVFQSYALWPHMTVAENVAYGLQLRKVPSADQKTRVGKILDRVGLSGFADRYPSTLSGGQQQRVALARSLVVEAEVILFDEPLSNLDLKLREEMRFELRQLIDRLGVTAIFVTHDQCEAMVLADRICLMRAGELVQEGPPREIYNHPQSRFAMDFLGSANFIDVRREGDALLMLSGQRLVTAPPRPGDVVGIRPEKLRFLSLGAPPPEGANVLDGRIEDAVFLGEVSTYIVDVGGVQLKVSSAESGHEVGDTARLSVRHEDVQVLNG